MREYRRLIYTNPYLMVADNRRQELAGRESLRITDTKRGITLNSRTTNQAAFGTAQQPDTQAVLLNTDKQYDFNEAVPWLDEMEVAPSLQAAVDMWRVNTVDNKISDDIRVRWKPPPRVLRGILP